MIFWKLNVDNDNIDNDDNDVNGDDDVIDDDKDDNDNVGGQVQQSGLMKVKNVFQILNEIISNRWFVKNY